MSKQTHVALVLDRSGSMSAIRDAIIEAFNEQLDTIRETADQGGETTVTFVTFGGSYDMPSVRSANPLFTDKIGRGGQKPVEVVLEGTSPLWVQKISRADYHPSGLTPMYDGVGRAIEILEARDDGGEDTAFLVVVLSDGKENHSQEWDADSISEKVKDLQNTGRWTFSYIGANQDLAEAVARDFNLPVGNVGTFDASPAGVAATSASLRGSTVSYMHDRAAGVTQTEKYAEDIEADSND